MNGRFIRICPHCKLYHAVYVAVVFYYVPYAITCICRTLIHPLLARVYCRCIREIIYLMRYIIGWKGWLQAGYRDARWDGKRWSNFQKTGRYGGLLQLTSYTLPEISSTNPIPTFITYLKEFKKQELLHLLLQSYILISLSQLLGFWSLSIWASMVCISLSLNSLSRCCKHLHSTFSPFGPFL